MIGRKEVHEEPIEVQAEDGNVALAGPDGALMVLSPEAPEETSDRLWRGAMVARGQQREALGQTRRRLKNKHRG